MDVSNEYAPLSSSNRLSSPAPGSKPPRHEPPLSRVMSFPLFWLGLIVLAALVIGGVVGQIFGLKSIEAYTELRGRLVAVQGEHDRLTEENNRLSSALPALRAQKQKAEEDFTVVGDRLKEVKETETSALNSLANAQSRLVNLQEEQKRESAARDTAEKAKNAANDQITSLNNTIGTLSTKKASLEESIKPLEQARSVLDRTLADLQTETKTLVDLSAQVTVQRKSVSGLTQQAAVLQEEVKTLQTRKEAIDDLKDDIASLQKERDQAKRDGAVAQKEKADAQKQLADVKEELQTTSGKLQFAQSESDKLKTAAAVLQGDYDTKSGEEVGLTKGIGQMRKDLATLKVELATAKEERDTHQQAAAVLAAGVKVQKQRVDELKEASLALEATKAQVASQEKEAARLTAQIAQKSQELANQQAAVRDAIEKGPSLREVLDALQKAIDAQKTRGTSESPKEENAKQNNAGAGN